MTVTWVLESDVFSTECFDQMIAHIRLRGLPLHIIQVIPFAHEIIGKAPQIEGPVVCYGSIGIQKVAEASRWRPGVFGNDATFTYEAYQAALCDLLLNNDAVKVKLSEVSATVERLGLNPFFIKPNDDAKAFAGDVMFADDFAIWLARMLDIGYLTTDDIDVVISKPKTLGAEWRLVVVDGEIVESSLYKQWEHPQAERHRLPEVDTFVHHAMARFEPAPVYMIDVAQVGDEFKVVEYNTFNTASLYACDVGRVIDAVTAYVEHQQ